MDTTQLYSEKEIYRPFWERNSAFLEVETGCSWHRCAFCDFARDSFSLFPIDEIQKKIELLAPAGNMEKMKMAILYGADAVYLAGKGFGLRAYGGNFDNEELEEAVNFAHARGRKV